MSVQTGGGALRIDPNDPQLKHRGKTIALKVRELSWAQVLGCILKDDGTWQSAVDLTGDLFSSDVPGGGDAVAYHLAGDAPAFVRAVILPNLNAWLATLWSPLEGGETVPPLEQLHAALLGLRFVVKPDGTVVAE